MSSASSMYWTQPSPASSMRQFSPQQVSPPIQSEIQQHQHQQQLGGNALHQQQHQSQFLPPTSAHSAHAQYHAHQPQLQLEHHYDLVGLGPGQGLTGLDSFAYNPPSGQSSQQQSVVLGVGQGAGNISPKYMAPTATALAADAYPSDAFIFGQQQQSQNLSSPNSGDTSPEGFGANFSFVADPRPSAARLGPGMPESISPHEALHLQHPQQEYLDPSGYTPHHKRRRADTTHDPHLYPAAASGDGSGEEDVEYASQYAYGHPGEQYEGYSQHILGQPRGLVPAPGQSTDQGLQQRLNAPGQGFSPESESGTGAQGPQTGQEGRPKQAACVRCKNLKVRCEFTTDPNTCRRCLNGGHECAIPGRKKRRQPPKREHLMNEIRTQAQKIQELMQKLEDANRRTRLQHNEPTRLSLSNTPLPPPGSTPVPGRLSISSAPGGNHVVPRPDVQEWIERARESIQTIGGLIDNGPFAEDNEGDEEGDEEELEGDDGYEGEESYFEESGTENADGSTNTKWRQPAGECDTDAEGRDVVEELESEASTPPPSIPRTHSGGRSGRRKTPQPSRFAPLPTTPAAPFGLIAQLSIASEGHRQGSKSPRSSFGSTGISAEAMSREASVEAGTPASTEGHALSPPISQGSTFSPRAEPHSRTVSLPGGADDGSGSEVKVSVKHEESSGEEYGAAAPRFFEARRGSVPDPSRLAPARHPVPHILMRGIVTPHEVEILFNIYFEKMNLSCSLLDPILYTAQKTYWRSPFLFTVICAIASRYYPDHSGLYEELITYAQLAAGTALISGPKNVETVSAYILLSLYPVPMRRWEEDRTWLYLGLAIRVATDLNLHHPSTVRPRNEQHARELLNRTRVWLNCFNLDRSTSSWLGKASTISSSDYIACHSGAWYGSSPLNLPSFDIQLAAYNAELRLMDEFKQKIYSDPNNPTGLNKDLDLNGLSSEIDEKLVADEAEWTKRLVQNTDPNDSQGCFRNSLVKLAYRYSRLIVLSFGFQHSFGKGQSDQSSFFDRCYRAATDVLRVFVDELTNQKIYVRHGPEAQCVFVTFASSFLIKILHPKYATYLKMEQRVEIHQLVRGIIDLLSSPDVVVDDKHSPKLWARFLEGLLATPMARIELSPSALKGGNALSRRSTRRMTQNAISKTEKQNSPSYPFPPTQGVTSPATHSANSSMTTAETLNISPTGISGTLSAPPPVLPTAAEQDRYSTTSEHSPNAAFDFSQGQNQRGYQADVNTISSQQQQPDMSMYETQNALQMNVPEFFQPALFDSDLLQTMQSMPDPSLWQNMPGFNWMGMLQTADTDSIMQDVLTPSMNFNPHVSGKQY
ncbi:hypothetical protein DFH11DRAFT_463167 [Phellopilus nigrolimitatus]|nr:hypothetical protein DFH11DRAFT_463167 [Phellopilus nigrolimitatus]